MPTTNVNSYEKENASNPARYNPCLLRGLWGGGETRLHGLFVKSLRMSLCYPPAVHIILPNLHFEKAVCIR